MQGHRLDMLFVIHLTQGSHILSPTRFLFCFTLSFASVITTL